MSSRTPHSPELQRFNREIYCLLKAYNPLARSLLSFIARTLRQFHLEGIHTEPEVFNEAYLRGVAFVLKGNEISNLPAWMRSTAYNVIRELSREGRKYQSIDYETSENLLVTEEAINLDIEAVLLALKELESSDRRIIELRTMENLSWREVGQHLVALGETVQSETALRKRGQRAMQKLRQAYHKIRPPQTLVH